MRTGIAALVALAAVVAGQNCPAAEPKLPPGYTCEMIRAQFAQLPAGWSEQTTRAAAKTLGFTDHDFDAAKRCMARDGRFTGSGNREK